MNVEFDRKKIEEIAIEWYIANRPLFKKLTSKIENILIEIFELRNISYHIITSRTKDIDSYKKKISNEKYSDPIAQITDLSGIRVITYVEDELESICRTVEEIFDVDPNNSLDKSKELGIDKVGYKSIHFIAKLKNDRINLPEYQIFANKCFEIQVRTILQHAWAEIEHDRNYKFSGKLPDEINRRFKLLAGSLEISDKEFNNIAREIDKISKHVAEATKAGELDIEINSTSLKQYIETKFAQLYEKGYTIVFDNSIKPIAELESYGITTLDSLDRIIPNDFIETFMKCDSSNEKSLKIIGFIRLILLINDAERYFSKAWKNSWKFWSTVNQHNLLFEHYGIDWDKIYSKYEVSLTPVKIN